jgi:uncharacterized membrane protein
MFVAMRRLLLVALCAPSIVCQPASGQIQFYDLDALTGTNVAGVAGVSADGSVLVGTSWNWPETPQIKSIFVHNWNTKETKSITGESSVATDLSADGKTIVGFSESYVGNKAIRWTESGGIQNLGWLSGGETASRAMSVNGDGSVVVGYSGGRAFRWTASSGMQDLGSLPDFPSAFAMSLSTDGSKIVGFLASGWEARTFLWTGSGGMRELGALPGNVWSQPQAISDDGVVVVGSSSPTDSSGASFIRRAFRWTEAGGMQEVDSVLGRSSIAHDVNRDGSVIVGEVFAGNDSYQGNDRRAFFWNAAQGLVDLHSFLTARGVDLADWILSEAFYISSDGRAIAGYGMFKGALKYYLVKSTIPFNTWIPPIPAATPSASPTPTPAPASLTSVKLLPPKRTVKAGKTARLVVLVTNNSTKDEAVNVVFDSSNAGLVPDPKTEELIALGKKKDTSRARASRKTFSFDVPEDFEGGNATITAFVGSLSSTCDVKVLPIKRRK